MIRELAILQRKYGVQPGLEGGEGETFVLDCPLFDRRIEILSSETHWKGDAGYLEILNAHLAQRNSPHYGRSTIIKFHAAAA